MNEQLNAAATGSALADWREYLGNRGIVDGRPVPTDRWREVRPDSAIIADLGPLAAVRARGADVTAFLQGQLSCDIGAIDEGGHQLCAYCTPKGRMLAVLRILRDPPQGYLLVAPRATLDKVLPRLRMYVLRARVEFEFADDRVILGYNGAAAAAVGVGGGDPPLVVRDRGALLVARFPQAGERGLAVATVDAARRVWEMASATAVAGTFDAWRWLEIVHGVPTVWPATMEEIIPQWANLDLLDAISFRKGCYPGQEIVARIRYLGKVKQRMVLGHVGNDVAAPEPGMPVFGGGRGDSRAGLVVDCAPAPGGGHDLLAVAPSDRDGSQPLTLGADGSGAIVERPLPYAVPPA